MLTVKSGEKTRGEKRTDAEVEAREEEEELGGGRLTNQPNCNPSQTRSWSSL